jgi:histidinol-phosphate aminotransferase
MDNAGNSPSVRPTHGGAKPAELRALGLKPEDVLDFSASVSPVGAPEGVWEALNRVDLAAYPDPQCLLLRESISEHLSSHQSYIAETGRVSPSRILVGNGSTEIIHLLARAYLSPSRIGTANTAFILTPTYGEYVGACGLMGASITCLNGIDQPGFKWDLGLAAKRISQEKPSLIFLCNPNNPTGVFLGQQEVTTLAQAAGEAGGLLVVDEAYLSFVDEPWDSLPLTDREPVILVRSMTKDYGLTALRLGYSVASEEVTTRLAALQPDWSVNGFSQAAGLAALADTGYLERARRAVSEAKEFLSTKLTELEFHVPPASANFLLVQVGDAASWRDKLLAQGLVVRDCASFGLPEYLRLGIRSLPDCQRLVEVMTRIAR